ncbi:non-ribosomal peptide synthetase/type I polyketide synthase [Rhodovulum sulfidophilum]|uniref:non-ribosomal peptide synthetase/type I polyketide synthase n=1 Tax=Rhodovulum sulfidophilum TaxID=35806 RepID=UPI001389BD4A|nr:non-ribosomal peptide synthetase/type I polyketide synthase [Rhodovulum sulfidophilum]NDK36498.1 amino acid adenylation domain-containing protein [Rhodovulum sulfidophilum]
MYLETTGGPQAGELIPAYGENAVAIVGMALRVPGADTVPAFWSMLREGRDGVVELGPSDLERSGLDPALIDCPGYVARAAVLSDPDCFDYALFGLSRREAEGIDPQHRLFLQCLWSAFEDSGRDPRHIRELCGVFASARLSMRLMRGGSDFASPNAAGLMQTLIGADKDYLATRAAYLFDLRGPAMTVQTACSSSLVAVHMAAQSLLNGECDLAVAGGVTLNEPQHIGYFWQEGLILSRDGICRPFDAEASGTIGGNGCGVVILRRLADAVADGDPVAAVIRGSAVNNDGAAKAGYTAPGVEGQIAVLTEALAAAGAAPESLCHVETHGTGTGLGDPVEASALAGAFGPMEGRRVALGSVKANTGHLDAAAGVVSLIKAALALQHAEIPPLAHFKSPHPDLALDGTGFYIPLRPEPMTGPGPLRAGVSSFGFGGTNAHAVLERWAGPGDAASAEETPGGKGTGESRDAGPAVLPLAAPDPEALSALKEAFRARLFGEPEADARAVARAAAARPHVSDPGLHCRAAVIALQPGDLAAGLSGEGPALVLEGEALAEPAPVFVFSGQGSQRPGVSAELFDRSAAYREMLQRCAAVADPVWPPGDLVGQVLSAGEERLGEPEITQPVIYAAQVASAAYWQALGVEPAAVLGQSFGEFAAAVVAGVMTPETGMRMILARTTAIAALPQTGAMASVHGDEVALRRALAECDGAGIAAVNGPGLFVISGLREAVEQIAARLDAEGVSVRPLRIAHALHGALMDPALAAFGAAIEELPVEAPRLPFFSSALGRRFGPDERPDAAYWVQHMRQPVRFAEAAAALGDAFAGPYLDLGMDASAVKLLARNGLPEAHCIPTLDPQLPAGIRAATSAAWVWMAGVPLDWSGLQGGAPQHLPGIPGYPFAKTRLPAPASAPSGALTGPALHRAAQAAGAAALRGAQIVTAEAFGRGRAALEHLARLYLCDALSRVDGGSAVPRFRPFVRRVSAMLEAEGHGLSAAEPGEIAAAEARARATAGDSPGITGALEAVGRALPDILTGARDPLEVLHSAGTVDQAFAIYSETPTARFFNPVVREAFRALLEGFGTGRALSVAEIGAGTGATAARLLPLLRPETDRYLFTDIGPAFVEAARQTFVEYGQAEYAVLDIGQDPEGQGVAPGTADIAVAVNVLHAAPDIDAALAHTAALLAPGGFLILDELTSADCLSEISTGLLIPSVTDARREGQPFMTPEGWRAALEAAGFEDIRILPDPGGPLDLAGEHVILARKAGELVVHEDPRPMLIEGGLRCYAWQWLPGEAAPWAEDPADLVLGLPGEGLPAGAVPAGTAEDIRSAVAEMAGSGGAGPLRLLDLRALKAGEEGPDPADTACLRLLDLVTALEGGPRVQVTLVLRNGALGLDGDAADPVQAALMGLARVIAIGHPELDLRICDTGDLRPDAALARLRPDAAISALRAGEMWVPRIAERPMPGAAPFRAGPADAALIFGGAGGIGQKLALWLAGMGCGRIFIAGRAPAATPLPDALAPIAARITRLQADARNPAAMDRMEADLAEAAPDLSLIFHCAALTEAADLPEDPRAAFSEILAPKTRGAAALDRLSRRFPVRQFVLFSSSVSMAPTYGLPHYAAANAYLDGLAARRRSEGLPGLSVSWGAWSDAGVVAREGEAGRLEKGGLRGVASDLAFGLLARAMGGNGTPAHIGLIDMDWKVFLRAFGEGNAPDVYAGLAAALAAPRDDGAPQLDQALRRAVADASGAEAPRFVLPLVAEAVGAALGREGAALDPDVQLTELGLDSLMFLDCVSKMSRDLGVKVSPNAMFRDFTLKGIARHFATAMREGAADLPVQIGHDAARRHDPFPLSDVQEAYWIGRAADMDLGAVACHGYSEIDCPDLDLRRLEAAWNAVLVAHDMLRAVVGPDGRQRVLPMAETGPYRIRREDLTDLSEPDRQATLQEIRQSLSHKVTDASCWPLFEIRATEIGLGLTRLHFSLDNIVADGRSIGLVLQQWMEAYGQAEPHVEAPAIGFRDYMTALSEWRCGPDHAAARDYWQGRLDDLPPAPALPLDARAEPGPFRRLSLSLPSEDWARLRGLAAETAGLTPSGLLLACYAEALSRYSGQSRLTVNVPTFNRQPLHPDINEVVGEFTSMILLGLDLEGPAFADRARAVQERLFEDQRHDGYSGIQVMRDLARRAGDPVAARMPVVFTSTFGLTASLDGTYSGGADRIAALGTEVFTISQTPQVLLDCHVHDRDGRLNVHWDYRSGRLPAAVVEPMFEAFSALIWRLAEGPGAWAEADPMPLPAGQAALWQAFNRTAAPALLPPPEETLTSGFLRSLADRPEALALAAGGQRLDYAGLAARAGQWLAALKGVGAGPGTRVAISLPKGAEQIAACLAVVLSGAAYVPVSPCQPALRRQAILEHAAPVAVIADDGGTGQNRGGHGGCRGEGRADVPVLTPAEAAAHAPAPLTDSARAEDLAYIVFTSGSTGTPKGVAVRHRAALATLRDVQKRFALSPTDRVFGVSDLGFDLSVFDIFATFAAGAALVLPDPCDRPDPTAWAAAMQAGGASVWNSAPAVMEIALCEPQGMDALRLVMLSGDWIPLNLPGRIRAAAPAAEIHSLGGATEAGIWSVGYPLSEGIPEGWSSVPYGRPLANQSLHVLDARMRPCPPLVPGDLYIGGAALADGYWQSPEQTAAAFLQGPDGGLLYRTGDIARLHPSGVIEFLGRSGSQLKINGRRVETGEIEAAFLALPGVTRAIVAARSAERGAAEGASGRGVALVAWVLGDGLDPVALRAGLARRLPPELLPGHIAILARLPVTPNGKIDMRALPDCMCDDMPGPVSGTVPAAGQEGGLAARLCAALGVRPEDRHRNLFELGVTSLAMARAVAGLRAEGLSLQLADIYAAQDLETLASRLTGPQQAAPDKACRQDEMALWCAAQEIAMTPEARREVKARNAAGIAGGRSGDVPLPQVFDPGDLDLRYSCRSFRPGAPSQEMLGAWLAAARLGMQEDMPVGGWGSAGAAFPLDLWSLMPEGEGYRWWLYRPAVHALRPGRMADLTPQDLSPMNGWVSEAHGLLAVAADMSRLAPLYGGDAARLALLEAGAASQTLELSAAAAGLGCCQLGDIDRVRTARSFGAGEGVFVLNAMAFGLPDPDARATRRSRIAPIPAQAGAPPCAMLIGGADHGDLAFGDLRAALPAGWTVLATPEREPALPPVAWAAGIDTGTLPGDLLLVGHSLGGLHAWALAERLEAEGRPARAVAVIDARPFDAELVAQSGGPLQLFAMLNGSAARAESLEALWHRLPDGHPAKAGGLSAFGRRHAQFAEEIAACTGYAPMPLAATPAILLAAGDNNPARIADGWRALGLVPELLPGDHLSCLCGAGAGRIAACLRAAASGNGKETET